MKTLYNNRFVPVNIEISNIRFMATSTTENEIILESSTTLKNVRDRMAVTFISPINSTSSNVIIKLNTVNGIIPNPLVNSDGTPLDNDTLKINKPYSMIYDQSLGKYKLVIDKNLAYKSEVNELASNKVDKTTQIIAGKGLTGGGDLSTNRTLNVVSANDGIIVNDNNITLNLVNDVTNTSVTQASTANATKLAYDKGVEALNRANQAYDKGVEGLNKGIEALNVANTKATPEYVDTKISQLVNSAPETLDTLKELSDALGNDPNFAVTVANNIGNKADKTNQIIAGNGLIGGGDLTTNRTLNVVSANNGIIVNNDNLVLNPVDSYNSTSVTQSPTANALKQAYDNLNASKLNISGGTMTGNLSVGNITNINNLTFNAASSDRMGISCTVENASTYFDLKLSDDSGGADKFRWLFLSTGDNDIYRTQMELYPSAIGDNKAVLKLFGEMYAQDGSKRVYHEGYKPSKTDVGLSNVNNWGASSDINANSTEQYATTNLVKQVHTIANAKMSDGGTYGTIYINDWFRANGTCGLYFQTHGGGINMIDETWVRIYNNKQFYVSSTATEAIKTEGGVHCSSLTTSSIVIGGYTLTIEG